jgi:hypothetical protein
MQFHHYTLADLEQMIPWQRQIYLNMVEEVVKSDNEKQRDAIIEQQRAIVNSQRRMRPAEQTNPRQGMAAKR